MVVCLRFALSGSSNVNGKLNSELITVLCVELVIHNRKDKANPKNNTLPILSETPSTSNISSYSV